MDVSKKFCQTFAIVSNYSVRNSEHELQASEMVKKHCGTRISLSSNLTQDLNTPRRAYTTTLNAKIQPLMEELILAVKSAMEEFKINAPLMMVKGDGSIDPSEFAVKHPIKTIASGPAASVIGACTLTGIRNFVVSDTSVVTPASSQTLRLFCA